MNIEECICTGIISYHVFNSVKFDLYSTFHNVHSIIAALHNFVKSSYYKIIHKCVCPKDKRKEP